MLHLDRCPRLVKQQSFLKAKPREVCLTEPRPLPLSLPVGGGESEVRTLHLSNTSVAQQPLPARGFGRPLLSSERVVLQGPDLEPFHLPHVLFSLDPRTWPRPQSRCLSERPPQVSGPKPSLRRGEGCKVLVRTRGLSLRDFACLLSRGTRSTTTRRIR